MNKNITLDEVQSAGTDIVMGTGWIEPFGFVFITLGIILLADLLYQISKKEKLKSSKGILKLIGAFALLISPFYFNQGPTTEEKMQFQMEHAEWKEEKAAPYINGLPKIKVDDIVKVRQSAELAAKGKKFYSSDTVDGMVLPLIVETESGEIYEFWMDVIAKENTMEPKLEFQRLDILLNAGVSAKGEYLTPEEEYGYNYPPGIYNAKLRISEKDYKKLLKKKQKRAE